MPGTFTKEQHQKTKEHLDQGSGNFFKPRQGLNRVRLFPPPDDYNDISAESWIHQSNENGQFQSWVCPKRASGGECEYCTYADQYRSAAKSGDKEADKIVRAFGPRLVVFMIVDDVKDAKPIGPKIWQMSKKRAKDIYAACFNDEGDFVNVSHPENGFDIIFQRTGENLDTEYTGLKRADRSTPLRNMDWLEDYPDVRELAANAGSTGGSSSGRDEEDDRPAKPTAPSSKGKAKTEEKPKPKPDFSKKPKAADPEPEEAEETETEEPEEKPAPKPAGKAKPKAKEPEPADEDDDAPPPCFGQEWVEGDNVCVDCPFYEAPGPTGETCQDLTAAKKPSKAAPPKPKFVGKPVKK